MNLPLAKYIDRYLGILICYTLAALHLFREMISPREGRIEVKKILLTKFWGFGNIVMLLPIIRLVKERYPEAEVQFLTLEENRPLLEGNPWLDGVITIRSSGFFRLIFGLLRTIGSLRRQKIDLFLDFEQFSRTSTIIGFLINAPQRIGLQTPRQGRYLLYTAPVAYRNDQHMTRTFLQIARTAGVRSSLYVPEAPVMDPDSFERVDKAVGPIDGPLVVVHVGSGDNFIGRRWPATSFARLTDRLTRERGVVPVFTGSPAEAPLVETVIGMMEEGGRARNLVGKISLGDLAPLISRADLLLANDTGPVHLASALGRPTLAFYGPNTPVLYGPLAPRSHAFYKNLPCSPCITNMNYKTSFCRLPVCIENIRVDEVFEEARSVLSDLEGAGQN